MEKSHRSTTLKIIHKMSVAANYLRLLAEIEHVADQCGRNAKEIGLVAVSKTYPIEALLKVYAAGCRDLGESRLLEVLVKKGQVPQDICWHLIGSLQRNKVLKALGQFSLIHSIDTVELAEKVAFTSEKAGLTTPILLQVNTSAEASKHGLSAEQWVEKFPSLLSLPGIVIQGLMTIAPYQAEEYLSAACFRSLSLLRERLQLMAGSQHHLKHLSMGMSGDWRVAVREGATLLRIGTIIFGGRKS